MPVRRMADFIEPRQPAVDTKSAEQVRIDNLYYSMAHEDWEVNVATSPLPEPYREYHLSDSRLVQIAAAAVAASIEKIQYIVYK